MSKKDYQVIARAFYQQAENWRERASQDHEPEVRERFVGGQWAIEETRNRVADVLAADNPRFDRARFLEACETGTCKGMRS